MTEKSKGAVETFEPISGSVSQIDQEQPAKSKKLFRFFIGSDIPPIPDVGLVLFSE